MTGKVEAALEQLNIELTETQKMAIGGVRWLMFGCVRSGRTHLMACAILERLLELPTCGIEIWDHWPEQRSAERLLEMVIEMIQALNKKGWHITYEARRSPRPFIYVGYALAPGEKSKQIVAEYKIKRKGLKN